MFKLIYTVGDHIGATVLDNLADALAQLQTIKGSGLATGIGLISMDGDTLVPYHINGYNEFSDTQLWVRDEWPVLSESNTLYPTKAGDTTAVSLVISDAVDQITGHVGQAVKQINSVVETGEKLLNKTTSEGVTKVLDTYPAKTK